MKSKNDVQIRDYQRKEVAYERVLFFCDAVVAIAITLLALNLKLNIPDGRHLTFGDLVAPWHQYVAFLLSFFNIALFWRAHHDFFIYIKKMDTAMMTFNICWLFLIVILPFSTSLLSTHFGDTVSVLFYSVNVFLIAVFQNCIWDYACRKDEFIDSEKIEITPELRSRINLMVNLDMINALVAIVLSFFMPKTAFFLLFFKVPVFIVATFYVARQRRLDLHKQATE